MIEILDGFWVRDLDDIKVVKRVGKNKCAVWLAGMNAMDGGFVLDCTPEELFAVLDGDDEEDDIEDEEEEGDGNED